MIKQGNHYRISVLLHEEHDKEMVEFFRKKESEGHKLSRLTRDELAKSILRSDSGARS